MIRRDTFLVVGDKLLGQFYSHSWREKDKTFIDLFLLFIIPQNCITDHQQDTHIILIPDVIPPFTQNTQNVHNREHFKNCTQQCTERPQIVLTILERY